MATPAPKIRFREPQIEMAHGAGGKASRRLIEGLFAPILFGSSAGPLGDAAHIQIHGTQSAITTDTFVVKPPRFPGGPIRYRAASGSRLRQPAVGQQAQVGVGAADLGARETPRD